jgi:adenine-specific DNA-methyltransferase
MDGNSLNLTQDLLEKLKAVAPEAFTEDKLDVQKLQTLLGEAVSTDNERYQLSWAGKSEGYKVLQRPTTATLIPQPEQSVNWDEAENVFIEGENLEVLKVLQKSYYGKIKMIYIDPPYNTGSDSFIYPDKFSETKEEYLKRIGEKDDEGFMMKEGLFRKNSKENGQFHSNWLNMMLPRLFLARNLLKDDGVIFVSIGADEQANLKLLLDEIFGEENFIECISWNKRVPKNDKGIGNIHEYILIYAKNSSHKHEFTVGKEGLEDIEVLLSKLKKKKVSLHDAEEEIKVLYKKKGYDRGITLYNSLDANYRLWGKINMSWPNADSFGPRYEVLHPFSGKPVSIPDRGWRWIEETFQDAAKIVDGKYESIIELHDGTYMCGRIWFDKNESTQPSSVNYLDEVDTFLLRSILSLKSDGGIEVENLFEGKSYFSYPKPTSLLKLLIKSFKLNNGDFVFDFFAGSGTLAHAVLDLNEEDKIQRRFLCVQLPEKTEEGKEAFKAGYLSIADVALARIKKVIDKIIEGRNGKLQFEKGQILGFRKYTLSGSNFKIWRSDVIENEEDLKKQMSLFVTPQRANAVTENILWELLIKNGVPLTEKIKLVTLSDGATIYHTSDNRLAFVLDMYSSEVQLKVLELKPRTVICLDSLFHNEDKIKTNAQLKFEDNDISFKTV